MQSLHDEWGVKGPTADLLINDLALCYYRLSRLEFAKSVKSNSLFSDHLKRKDFCIRLGLEFDEAKKLPDWFFDTSLETIKMCEQAKLLLDQCDHLRKNMSPDVVKNAHKELRELWLYVMGDAKPEKDVPFTKRICELMDCEKRHSKNLQCLRRLASSCLWCVSKCVSSAAFQSTLSNIFSHTNVNVCA